jgi:hypothetical protein
VVLEGDIVRELTDAAIEEHLRHAAMTPSELSLMHLYSIDRAVHAVGPSETPWGARDATWSMVIAAIDPDPAKAAGPWRRFQDGTTPRLGGPVMRPGPPIRS